MEVLVHHHRTDGHAIDGSKASVLHIDGNGNLGVVHRGKAHEDGVVLAAILSGAGLATSLYTGQYGPYGTTGGATRAARHCGPHPLHHLLVVGAVDARVAARGVERIEGVVFNLLHDVGGDEVATVGNGGTEVGYLQGGGRDFALANGDTDDGQTVPRAAVGFVVGLGVGDKAALLTGEVGAELVAKALGHHVVFPHREGLLRRAVLAVANHAEESPAEVGVARGGDGGYQGERRAVAVAPYVQALVVEAVGTGEGWVVGMNNILLQEGEGLGRLEGGAWGIGPLDGAVEERLAVVQTEALVVLAALTANHQVGVEGGRRDHAEDFARRGFNGHDGPYLVLHKPFAQHLQVDVEPQGEVLARHRGAVEFAILVVALHPSVGIAQQHLHTLFPTQVLLVRLLDALLAHIVAANVVVVGFNLLFRHLADVAQGMACGVVGVLADGASLDVEARKLEELFLKDATLLGRELRHEGLMRVFGVAGVHPRVAHILHALLKLLHGDTQRATQVERVELRHLAGHEGDVVGRLVEDEQLAIAVVDGAPRGVLYLVEESVAVGIALVVVGQQLQIDQTQQIDHHDGNGREGHHVFPFLKGIIFSQGSMGLRVGLTLLQSLDSQHADHAEQCAADDTQQQLQRRGQGEEGNGEEQCMVEEHAQ